MENNPNVHIVMPVKDSISTAEESIRAIVQSGYTLTVYDDNSTAENAARLDTLATELGINVIHIRDYTDHPSPNYRWVLIDAQDKCLKNGENLLIIESDVIVKKSTINKLCEKVKPRIGLIAAATTSENGTINFPYEYARGIKEDGVCKKRISFCCTLLTNELLQAYDFNQLDPSKNWYDVHISHVSRKLGFDNILQVSNPVLHKPHSSRPWKQQKYTNPLLYYWRKITQRKDKI
ncbi:MAG: glycosyltransferase family 2 protein [Paludibacteraceae bacterium]|nr:glycosyltransferase family 2 protein [Paludibacteraceae bacterium]